MLNDKEKLYRAHITRSLAEMYQHMEDMLSIIPDEMDGTDLTDEQIEVIERVEAIEEEWILDPETRREISLIDWCDEEEG